MSSSAQFKQAAEDSRKLKQKPTDNELLELYALYKVGSGEDFSKAEKPGMFDLKGKAKHGAWKKEVDAGTSAEAAQEKYVALVDGFKEKYGFEG